VEELAEAVREATGEAVELAYVEQRYTGEKPAGAAEEHGIRLEVVKRPEAKRGFVLLPRGWVVERDLRGRRAFGGWSRMTSGCLPRWRAALRRSGEPLPSSSDPRTRVYNIL